MILRLRPDDDFHVPVEQRDEARQAFRGKAAESVVAQLPEFL
jgi:hypothetical protein